jgi:AmmeMemoRadiSam system protein B
VRANPAVFMREHALEIQLRGCKPPPGRPVLPLLVGELEEGTPRRSRRRRAPLLAAGTLVVVSSDLTHYGRRFDYLPVPAIDAATVAAAVRRLDDAALDRIVARDADGFVRHVEETGATICGGTRSRSCSARPRGRAGRSRTRPRSTRPGSTSTR